MRLYRTRTKHRSGTPGTHPAPLRKRAALRPQPALGPGAGRAGPAPGPGTRRARLRRTVPAATPPGRQRGSHKAALQPDHSQRLGAHRKCPDKGRPRQRRLEKAQRPVEPLHGRVGHRLPRQVRPVRARAFAPLVDQQPEEAPAAEASGGADRADDPRHRRQAAEDVAFVPGRGRRPWDVCGSGRCAGVRGGDRRGVSAGSSEQQIENQKTGNMSCCLQFYVARIA